VVSDYEDFLRSKDRTFIGVGLPTNPEDLPEALFDFQRAITAWACGKGRAAIWADTGLGKTVMEAAWLDRMTGPEEHGLILAPLAVTHQTVREAKRLLDMDITYVRNAAESARHRLSICNYERLDDLDPSMYTAVVLDESSILKSFSGTTKRALVERFKRTPYRLSASATPAPNDLEELCNHADFLGVMAPQEMRSTFFIADSRGQFMKYRIKGHAESAFYGWLASWAMACRTPSDLGFDDDGYILPGLNITAHYVESEYKPEGELFLARLNGITERATVRKATLAERCELAARLVEAESDDSWLIWCGLNDESTTLARLIEDAVEVAGSDPPQAKADALMDFADGRIRALVTKPSIAGMGMNFQSCARMVFVGLNDSYEQYYQAIRRCYRFGQEREVHVHIVLSDAEESIYANVLAKEQVAKETASGLIGAVAERNRAELFKGTSKADSFEPTLALRLPAFLCHREAVG
jgi:hypothetical protein